MSKEYEKIRVECAKKYNSRIKELEQRVKQLETINKAQSDDLKNQTKLQREYVKLCIYLGLSEEKREAIMTNNQINDLLSDLLGSYINILSPSYTDSITSLPSSLLKGVSIDDAIKDFYKFL